MCQDKALTTLGFLLIGKRRSQRHKKVKKKRAMRVRDIYKQLEKKGTYHTFVQELQLGDEEFYFK